MDVNVIGSLHLVDYCSFNHCSLQSKVAQFCHRVVQIFGSFEQGIYQLPTKGSGEKFQVFSKNPKQFCIGILSEFENIYWNGFLIV